MIRLRGDWQRTRFAACVLFLVITFSPLLISSALAASDTAPPTNRSLTDRSVQWPSWEQWRRVIFLEDYNTRVVVFGVAVLGGAAGLVGSFTLLRKRALMGDALSHASLPGIALAFVIATAMGHDGKSMWWLMPGATLSGLLGVAVILWIRNSTRLKEDTALGIVLSVFFGAGVAILSVAQQMDTGSAAGLEGFIYGKTASMRAADAQMIVVASFIAVAICLLLFKELKLLCFDEGFAGSRGFPVVLLDVALMTSVILITIVGLQAVGLILMIALMVIPAAAARFWTIDMWRMTLYSVILGTVGSVLGATISAVFPKLPSGAMIVLVCSFFFFASMVFGRSRGVLVRSIRRRRLNLRVERQHLLRAMYEQIEPLQKTGNFDPKVSVNFDQLLPMRSWSQKRLAKAIANAEDDELVRVRGNRNHLTRAGFVEAARLTRQHRMWEMYLIAYADVATASVDRDADDIEHVLEPDVIDQLEDLLEEQQVSFPVPASPHELNRRESNDSDPANRGTDQ
jgi:manganese/zinc/iron transport system permease protein